jgi:hypothetical protein
MGHNRDLIYIAMRGGLGNQLFQWQAGKLLQFFTDLDIEFIPQQRKLAHGDVGIRAFDFPDVTISKARSRTVDFWLKKLVNEPDIGLTVKTSISKRATFFQEGKNIEFTSFCEEQKKNDSPYLLDGYFQSSRINQCLKQKNSILNFPDLKYESRDYIKLEKLISSGEFTAVHIRRGDYSKYSNSIGVLSESYYLQAAKRLDLAHSSQIIVFTDGRPEEITNEFTIFFRQFKNTIFAPKLNSSAELLVAMSKCSGIITANSTLSWWAGSVSSHTRVITPFPFFRDLPNRFDLQLPNAKTEIAKWL